MEKYAEKTADESEDSIQDLAALIGNWKTTGSAKKVNPENRKWLS